MLRVVVHQTALYDPSEGVRITFVLDEEINELAGAKCDNCDADVEVGEAWDVLHDALIESLKQTLFG